MGDLVSCIANPASPVLAVLVLLCAGTAFTRIASLAFGDIFFLFLPFAGVLVTGEKGGKESLADSSAMLCLPLLLLLSVQLGVANTSSVLEAETLRG